MTIASSATVKMFSSRAVKSKWGGSVSPSPQITEPEQIFPSSASIPPISSETSPTIITTKADKTSDTATSADAPDKTLSAAAAKKGLGKGGFSRCRIML